MKLDVNAEKEGDMVKRVLLIGLLGMSLLALVGTEASARVCVLKSAIGACLVWTGSIECGISATGVGSVLQDPVILACTATGTDQWAVACGNPGENTWTAPGVNLVTFSGIVSGEYQLQEYDVDRNGRAYGYAVAAPSLSLLTAIRDAGACPNLNWTVMDAVPCTMQVRDMQLDADGCITSDATYSCSLDNPDTIENECGTLGWNTETQTFERRQYECTQISTNTYKIPQYPDGGDCP
jgi:hypothetical protein